MGIAQDLIRSVRPDRNHVRDATHVDRGVMVPPPVNDRLVPVTAPDPATGWFVEAHGLPAADGEGAPIIMDADKTTAHDIRTALKGCTPEQTIVIMGGLCDAPDRPVRLELSRSLADHLVAYASHVAVQREPDQQTVPGVYCEELPARLPGSRLFRLPAYAAEGFYRTHILGLLPHIPPVLRPWLSIEWIERMCRDAYARIDYHAPCWAIDSRFVTRADCRLYSDEHRLLGPLIGRRIAVIRSLCPRDGIRRVAEHRPTDESVSDFSVQSATHPDHGTLIEITNGPGPVTAVLPYWITDEGRVMVALAHRVARGLVNRVPRNTPNLDQRVWSGVMREPFIVDAQQADDVMNAPQKWTRAVLGVRPAIHHAITRGPVLYPDPALLDLAVHPVYVRTEPITRGGDTHEWHDAQHVLDALAVGLIPNMELESMLIDLLRTLGVSYVTWADCPLVLVQEKPKKIASIPELVAMHEEKKRRFEFRRGGYGYLKPQRSLFLRQDADETRLAPGDHVDTIEPTSNRAVIVPLSLDLNGDVLAGLCLDALPVPDRYQKTGVMMHLPSLPLPADVLTMDDAARHIAAKLNIKQENVAPLGPSSFVALGMTDQRLYPFAVTAVGKLRWHPLGASMYAPLEGLFSLCWPSWSTSFLRRIHEAYASFMSTSDVGMGWGFAKRIDVRQPRALSLHAQGWNSVDSGSQRRDPG